MSHPLETLSRQVAASNDPDDPLELIQRLTVVTLDGLHHVEFYGSSIEEVFCETLLLPEVAENLVSLSLRGPDEGSNGTRNWNLEDLAAGQQRFPRLQTFSVELTAPADHNKTIIASSHDEDGVIARLANKCPQLAYLQVPSAPSPEFFDVPLSSLQVLSVDAGYATQNFIRHFAAGGGYPLLRCFEWGEYSERYMDDWELSCTPFTDYEALFVSPAFRTVRSFLLRQPALQDEQLKALKRLRPDLQFQFVRYSGEYVKSL